MWDQNTMGCTQPLDHGNVVLFLVEMLNYSLNINWTNQQTWPSAAKFQQLIQAKTLKTWTMAYSEDTCKISSVFNDSCS